MTYAGLNKGMIFAVSDSALFYSNKVLNYNGMGDNTGLFLLIDFALPVPVYSKALDIAYRTYYMES